MKPNTDADFWRFVELIPGCDCWIWTGKESGYRYGAFNIGGKIVKAHRFSWELANGPVPDGLHVLHRCDVGFCVRPSHLFIGTHKENMADREAKGRTNSPTGERNAWAKFNNGDIAAIRARYAAGETQVALAKEFGVYQTTISKIILRVSWAHVS